MSIYNPVIPKVHYNSDDAVSVDSPASAFNKYNNHEHVRASVGDFRYHAVQIGDPIYIYDSQGNDIFPDVAPTTVNYITGKKLRVSLTASVSLTNVVMYVKAPRGDSSSRLIFGVDTVQGSQEITLTTPLQPEEFQQKEGEGLPGFVSQTQLSSLALVPMTFQISSSTLSSNRMFVVTDLSYDARIVYASWYNFGADNSFSITFRDPNASPSQVFSNFSNWESYGSLVACVSPHGNYNYVDYLEEPLSQSFDGLTKASKYMPKGSSILLTMSSAPTALISLTLHLGKILD